MEDNTELEKKIKESEFILCSRDGIPLFQLKGKIIVFEEGNTYQVKTIEEGRMKLVLKMSKKSFSYIQNFLPIEDNLHLADILRKRKLKWKR